MYCERNFKNSLFGLCEHRAIKRLTPVNKIVHNNAPKLLAVVG